MARINNIPEETLSLHVNTKQVPLFFQLLGHGFCINVKTGCSVKELLCDQLGIKTDYLAQRIQTIFLNGKVVDTGVNSNGDGGGSGGGGCFINTAGLLTPHFEY